MKYIKLFERSYSIYELITMAQYQAGDLLLQEISKEEPSLDFIKEIIEHTTVDINYIGYNGINALHLASMYGYTKIVQLLLEHPDIDINKIDVEGNTALIWASYRHHEKIVKLLLDRPEIMVNIQDKSNNSALLWAAYKGDEKIIGLLLDHPDTDITLHDEGGKTAWAYSQPYIQGKFPQLNPNL